MRKMKMFVLVIFALTITNGFAASEEMTVGELNKLKENKKIINLAINPNFENGRRGYRFWKSSTSKGVAKMINEDLASEGSKVLKITNSDKGISVFQFVMVKPGEKYAITVNCLKQGESKAKVFVRFIKNQKGIIWFPVKHSSTKTFILDPKNSKWGKSVHIVTVPAGAAKMAVMLGTKEQKDNAVTYYDEFGIYKVK
jgi:hypothetical protein